MKKFYNRTFSDRKSDDTIIWGPEVTLKLPPMTFETKILWASQCILKNALKN